MPLSAEENELIRQHAIKAKLGQGVRRSSGGALDDQDYIWLGGYMLEGESGLWGHKCARRDGYTMSASDDPADHESDGVTKNKYVPAATGAYDPLTFGSWVWND